jgi:cytochrome c1
VHIWPAARRRRRGLAEQVSGEAGALAAAGGHAQLAAEVCKLAGAAADRLVDLAVGDALADADVHERGGLADSVAEAAAVPTPISRDRAHEGIFGTYDRAALQRGMQVYKGVCAGCHGLKYVAFRNLTTLGYGEDEIRAIAADYFVTDDPDDFGDMFEARPGGPNYLHSLLVGYVDPPEDAGLSIGCTVRCS